MIEGLQLNGFKSFINQQLDINNLTLLTGLNSSGKSSVIQAIRILGNLASGFRDPLLAGYGGEQELKNIYTKGSFSLKAIFNDKEEKRTIEYISGSTPVDKYDSTFPKVIYVSADRFGPMVSIPILSDFELGNKGENILNTIDHYSEIELDTLLRHPQSEGETFLFNLRAWLGTISPGVHFDYELIRKASSSYSTFNGHRAMNVGFGLSYTLPVIVALFLGTLEKNSIVMIENPEAHLHPKGQTELSKLIALAVEAGANVIIETHSDHIFDGLRVFAKKNKGFASNISTYWFELDADRNSVAERVEIDDNGRVNSWPQGMFDQFEINASELL